MPFPTPPSRGPPSRLRRAAPSCAARRASKRSLARNYFFVELTRPCMCRRDTTSRLLSRPKCFTGRSARRLGRSCSSRRTRSRSPWKRPLSWPSRRSSSSRTLEASRSPRRARARARPVVPVDSQARTHLGFFRPARRRAPAPAGPPSGRPSGAPRPSALGSWWRVGVGSPELPPAGRGARLYDDLPAPARRRRPHDARQASPSAEKRGSLPHAPALASRRAAPRRPSAPRRANCRAFARHCKLVPIDHLDGGPTGG